MLTALCLLLATAACTTPEDTMKSQEEVAAAARAEIDALAAKVGMDPVVKEDTLTDCVPGNDDSGKELIYSLHVKVEAGALGRLRTEIAPQYEADGWTVRQDSDGVRFLKGDISMGAKTSDSSAVASVGGSGGCVK